MSNTFRYIGETSKASLILFVARINSSVFSATIRTRRFKLFSFKNFATSAVLPVVLISATRTLSALTVKACRRATRFEVFEIFLV